MENVFADNNLEWDSNDERLDNEEDVSSSEDELDNPNYKRDYAHRKSNASCNIDEIQSIIFGGFSSRFWLFRKYMNTIDPKKLLDDEFVPFYSWECLTIQLVHRDIDLIIRKQSQMFMFLSFILDKIDSIDGVRGSRKLYHQNIFNKLTK